MSRTARRKPYKPTEGIEPVRGDHGTGTAAANASTVLVAVPGDKNGMKRRQRIGALESIMGNLSQRQYQAGKEIRDAFEETQTSPPAIKEIQVDVSPTPDATIDVQCDAQSRFALAMSAVTPLGKDVVDHVLLQNRPITELAGGGMVEINTQKLRNALTRVADKLNY